MIVARTVLVLVSIAPPSASAQDRARPRMAGGEPIVLTDLAWRCVGPTRGGRVTAVAGSSDRPGTFFMGTTGGGVWRTTDHGSSWRCVSDGPRGFGSPSIGAVRVAPSDADVVWVGTGSDGLRSNVIVGCGVYRSTDGGTSWRWRGLPKAGQIGAIEVHPKNSDVAYVAAMGNPFAPNEERGLYRTVDGGASWQRVLQVSPKTGAVDVELCPADPLRVYACMYEAERKPWTIRSGGREGGVWRSLDGGNTWHQLRGGLPDGLIGKADLAVTAADPTRLYVLIEAPGDAGGLYMSQDGGETFAQRSDASAIRKRPFYYTNVDASPVDPDLVFVSATRFSRSNDGGRTWQTVRNTPHSDHHDLWIDPARPDVWIQGADGGATITLDGGTTWSTLNNQPTAELYQIAVDTRFPYWLYAGQQDNSTIRVPSLPPRPSPAGALGFWESVGGCETGPAIPSPTDPDIVFAACKGRFSVYNARTGQQSAYDVGAANMYGHDPKDLRYRFQRVAPIHVSPHDPETIYHCSQYVHRTRDRGRTWETISPDLSAFDPERQGISGEPITRDITGEEFYSCIYEIAESPLEPGLIWVGANDGPIHVTRDGGATWTDVTPAGLPPGGRVQTIEPSPHDPGAAFACVLRYQLGDPRPWLFATRDHGATWTLLTPGDNGIPADTPVRVVREDPARAGLLYCGTEWGMFVSHDGGSSWRSLQLDLPITPITDLVVHPRGDLVASTMGRSFWILDDLTPLRAWPGDRGDVASAVLFEPRSALRLRTRSRRTVPATPPAGAVLDYWLSKDVPAASIALELRSPDGNLLRKFVGRTDRAAGRDASDSVESTTRMEEIELELEPEPLLASKAGHHRFVWDLRHPRSRRLGQGRGSRRGPMVAPGIYSARLVIQQRDGEPSRFDVPLHVQLDPRIAAEGITSADIGEQIALHLRIVAALRRASQLADRVRDQKDGAASEILSALVTAKNRGEYPQPMLIDQLGYLLSIVDGADQPPGRDAVERCAELELELARLEAKRPK